MDPLTGISANMSLASILSNEAVTPSYGLLASELSLSTPSLFSNSSTLVGISAKGQLLSATVAFQNKLQSLQPDTTTSYASLAAKVQTLVDAFNTLQTAVATINRTNNLPESSVPGASDLVQSLNTQAQANYPNGDSKLTKLSQLGIGLQQPRFPWENSKLSIDLDTLQAAFHTDAASAFSLISKAAGALGNMTENFISQSGSQYSSIDAMRSALGHSITVSNLFSQTQTSSNFFNLLAANSFPEGANLQQVFSAINEYTLVSRLFG